MKTFILIISIISALLISCKKDNQDSDAVRKVRYEFNGGGSEAYTTYKNIAAGGWGSRAIGPGFYIEDEVRVRDNALLHMTTEKLEGTFEIKINYMGKIIAIDNTPETDGTSKKVHIDHVFTEDDFKIK